MNYHPVIKAKNISFFLSVDGEIDSSLAINNFWKQKKMVFLPVLDPNISGHLLFIEYKSQTNLVLNKFKILEPEINIYKSISLNKIDIMLVPLVAFDIKGNRLGLGGGFYDRTLNNWKRNNFLPIGIAYDFQLVNNLPNEKWDIPLPVIITPSKIWQW
ncbi:5-formyltetrahydrofolate cyclo-ligase [Candidatus Pantoea edessiphila]|uniref:5-formyltetrahydrofolate cyclo-ligase n=1 Tax=Candidatus Pantoea edessiphila TaxID=2044610 RepID=UPI003075D159